MDVVKPADYPIYIQNAGSGGYTLHDVGPSLTANFMWFNLNRLHDARGSRRKGDPAVEDYKYRATWVSMTIAVAPVAYRFIIGSPLKTDW